MAKGKIDVVYPGEPVPNTRIGHFVAGMKFAVGEVREARAERKFHERRGAEMLRKKKEEQ